MQATFDEAKKICEKDSMAMLLFDSPHELSKITEYTDYIGKIMLNAYHAVSYLTLKLNLEGLLEYPLFSMLTPEMMSVGSSVLKNWGSAKPPGGPGSCLVLQSGSFYNATCEAERNFGCEEKKQPSGRQTTKHAMYIFQKFSFIYVCLNTEHPMIL